MRSIDDSLLVHGHQLHLTNLRVHNFTLSELSSDQAILKQLFDRSETGNFDCLLRKVSSTFEGVSHSCLIKLQALGTERKDFGIVTQSLILLEISASYSIETAQLVYDQVINKVRALL